MDISQLTGEKSERSLPYLGPQDTEQQSSLQRALEARMFGHSISWFSKRSSHSRGCSSSLTAISLSDSPQKELTVLHTQKQGLPSVSGMCQANYTVPPLGHRLIYLPSPPRPYQ